jgi:hypothetical protein
MGTQTRTAEALERKLEQHIKEHTDDMKNLKTEIQSLKIMKPKTAQKDHRPFNDNKRVPANAKNENYRKMSAKPLKNSQNNSKAATSATTQNNFGDKMTNKMVIFFLLSTKLLRFQRRQFSLSKKRITLSRLS